MLEASDMNDSAILAATTQKVNTQGQKQLSLTLPSGRVITSEWLPADARAGALITWCEAVRSQAVADEKEAAAKARRGSIAVEPTQVAGQPGNLPTTRCAKAKTQDVPLPPSVQDAHTYVRQSFNEAKAHYEFLEAQVAEAVKARDKARRDFMQWEKLLSSLEGINV